MQITLFLLFALFTTDYIEARGRSMNCIENYKCVPIARCRSSIDGDIVYPCNENQTHICCSPEHIIAHNLVVRTSAFPDRCGIVNGDNRITGGEVAGLGQFPWMALLGYKQQGLDFVQFLCGGSIITSEYILTAAHCISIDPRLELHVVRLGEQNLDTEIDCELQGTGENICADPYVDILVDKAIPHANYNGTSLENDIALVKLQKKINFTEYVQPICLPFQKDIDYKTVVNGKLTVSGWGKTDSKNIAGASQLQYTEVTVWDPQRCNISIPPKIRPVRESQLCANGAKKKDACKGDSGGPLVNITFIDGDVRNFQLGIVSFASAQVCGNFELPTIYTKVEYYLNWIVNNVVQTN